MRRVNLLAWFVFMLGMIYFFLPLFSTFEFSLRMKKGVYSFEAYRVAFQDPGFYYNFGSSLLWAALTILCSILLVVPTAYWVHWRLPKARPIVEFVTLMPFVIPAVVLTFGLIRLYGGPPLILTATPIPLIAGYVVLSLPYMYRSVDAGLRAIDIRTLTEAALSLGAGWGTIITQVILPNIRVAILSGVFLTFAIVMGEYVFASLLGWPAFAYYLEEIGAMRAYTPQALSLVSFGITWSMMMLIQWIGRGTRGAEQVAAAH
ncbi:MAG: ABC transporter permease subunit [Anaerolineales bacterium]|nr:ABC transporter permease subunit [Anaerolineales bacterium]MDW8162752.1 ABC transporter permease subunit [Anaerolineales bacterium]